MVNDKKMVKKKDLKSQKSGSKLNKTASSVLETDNKNMRNSQDSSISLSKNKQTSALQKPKRKYTKRSVNCSATDYKPTVGKQMPSLSVLEEMFEDDSDEKPLSHKQITDPIVIPKPPQKVQPLSNDTSCASEIANTPENLSSIITHENLTSPRTIKKIANEMIDYIDNMADPIVDDGPPPPITQPKKRRKPEEPYIVGCKERNQIPSNPYPSANFCKGDNDYGIDSSQGEGSDLDEPKKYSKRMKVENQCKSKFNSKSDEIATWYKDWDKVFESDDSDDSNKTVTYQLGSRPFSPKPSTSKDSDTIVENDKRFNETFVTDTVVDSSLDETMKSVSKIINQTGVNESLSSEPAVVISLDETMESDLKIINHNRINENLSSDTVATISLDETAKHKEIKIEEQVVDTIVINDDCEPVCRSKNKLIKKKSNNCSISSNNHDIKQKESCENSDIIDLDYYNFPETETLVIDDDVPEIIDVDSIIAENNTVINKYSEVKLNSVTCVPATSTSQVNFDNNKPITTETKHEIHSSVTSNSVSKEPNEKPIAKMLHKSNDNQIQTIVCSYFKKNTVNKEIQPNNTDLIFGMVMSEYGETIFRLFDSFTKWLKSFELPKVCKNINTKVTMPVFTEQLENDVIVIQDNDDSSTAQSSDTCTSRCPNSVKMVSSSMLPGNKNSNKKGVPMTYCEFAGLCLSQISRDIVELLLESEHQARPRGQRSQMPTSSSQRPGNLPRSDQTNAKGQRSQMPTSSSQRPGNLPGSDQTNAKGQRSQMPTSSLQHPGNLPGPHSQVPIHPAAVPHLPKPAVVPVDLTSTPPHQIHTEKSPKPVSTPTPPAQSTPNKKSIGDCPICMDSLSNKQIASTICGHIFCMSCIKASIRSNGKKCPTCRKSLKGMGYHPLFL